MNKLHEQPVTWLVIMLLAGYLITQYASFQDFVIIGIAVLAAQIGRIILMLKQNRKPAEKGV